MDGKKISFGFKKTKKAEVPHNTGDEEKKEFIECMEEKSIKVVGGETIKEDTPLVIPLKPNTLMTAEKLKKIAEEVESALAEPVIKEEHIDNDEKPLENESLDQMAARELLQEAKKKEIKVETTALSIPTLAKPVFDGEKESTLDDYDAVPIQQFGMAMLRGMGWTPNKDGSKHKQPELRPKGLGLGADKVIKENQKKQSSKDKKEDDLTIVKNSFVKITTGKYGGYYGKVVSLDEDNGRVMVDIAVKKETVSLSEFMMHAVTKSEYDKESKVINTESFEEYKKNERLPHKSSKEGTSSHRNKDIKYDKEQANEDSRRNRDVENSNGRSRVREREKRQSSSSEDRSSRRRKKDKKRCSSSDSISSMSDHEKKKKKKNKSRRNRSRSESSDSHERSPPKNKRDIDKKRKGKKKKRDRDRSPNYKKYRK